MKHVPIIRAQIRNIQLVKIPPTQKLMAVMLASVRQLHVLRANIAGRNMAEHTL